MSKKTILLSTLFVTLVTPLFAGDIVDRIVATVNGVAILQSDWDQAVSYEAFVEGRSVEQSTPDQRKAALDRLIDQELIRQQVRASDISVASAADVQQRIAQIRKQHTEAPNDASWRAQLQRYGLNETDLATKVAGELNELRAVDFHLRPSVEIDPRSVEAYYQQKLLPELRQTGAKDVPLDEVAPKIRELLAQQKMNDLLVNWLKNLRSESRVDTSFAASIGNAGGGGF